jgi:hypothetical protein
MSHPDQCEAIATDAGHDVGCGARRRARIVRGWEREAGGGRA